MAKAGAIARWKSNFQDNRSHNRSGLAASLLAAVAVVIALCAQVTPGKADADLVKLT